jgi:cell division protease FtsH
VARTQNVSDADAEKITAEIRKLVDAALAEATLILTEHRRELEAVAHGLLRHESLSGQEIVDLIAGKEPEREFDTGAAGPAPATAPEPEAAAAFEAEAQLR